LFILLKEQAHWRQLKEEKHMKLMVTRPAVIIHYRMNFFVQL
jgi:hypothetical protein